MFGSELLDLAIGMIFVYLLLSVICSAASEIIEAWLKNRASDLERGIGELLNDKTGQGFARKLYEHPLISALYQGTYSEAKSTIGRFWSRLFVRTKLPSYIPSRNFALALMDLVGQVKTTETVTTIVGGTASKSGEGSSVTQPGKAGSAPVGETGAMTVTTPPILSGAAGAVAKVGPSEIENLRKAIGNIGNANLESALLTLVDAAGGDAAKARQNIEDWFNSSMDRVSGWYKRRSHAIILVLGFLLTIFLNVDTIYVLKSLAHNTALRESLVTASQSYIKDQSSKDQSSGKTPDPNKLLSDTQSSFQSLGLPIGWNGPGEAHIPPVATWTSPKELSAQVGHLLYLHLIGWLITALAISLGAPFWFDMLNKVVVVRSTVKPNEKSPVEGSKDK